MDTNEHRINGVSVLEILDDNEVLSDIQDLLDIVSDFSVKRLIFRKEQINPDFFDLSTGLAGNILQKASTYRIHIGIVGDFSTVENKSLRDFIYESNQTKQIFFKPTVHDVLKAFCR